MEKFYKSYRIIKKEPTIDTSQYQQVLQFLASNKTILFITGQAGTGKSTLINYLRQKEYNIPVVAPTGIAAININGQTIHSFFKLPTTIINHEEIQYNKYLADMLKRLRCIIIDEISMVRADIMDMIDVTLKVNTKQNKPFGGVKLIMIGDLFQLPPVLSKKEEIEYLQLKGYRSPFFFDAKSLENYNLRKHFVEFKKIYRQNDSYFIELLSNIRNGNNIESTINKFNDYCYNKNYNKNSIIITPYNRVVDNINTQKLSELNTDEKTYIGNVNGLFNEKERYPAPMELKLKVGAQVMFVKNGRDWVNGTIGTVTKFEDDEIHVNVAGISYVVERESWENIKYTFNKDKIYADVIGTYYQFPLTLAWAVTIHKSQGKTFESVSIDIDKGAFEEGQLYVALSRCKKLSGINLLKRLSISDVKISDYIKSFYKDLKGN